MGQGLAQKSAVRQWALKLKIRGTIKKWCIIARGIKTKSVQQGLHACPPKDKDTVVPVHTIKVLLWGRSGIMPFSRGQNTLSPIFVSYKVSGWVCQLSLASHRDKSISTIITNNITMHSSSCKVPIIFAQGHPRGPFHVFVTKLLF